MTVVFIIWYLVCTSIVYQVAERQSVKVQHQIINDTCLLIAIELILYDLLVMPLTLAALGKCSKRVVLRFSALLV